jgi:two-component system sensor kinase FixL
MDRPDSTSSELNALLDAAVDAVIQIDHRGTVEVFNHSAERLFGYSSPEVRGQHVGILMTDRDRHQHDAYMERYIRTGVAHIIGIGRDVQGRRKDGTVFPAFLSVGRIAGSDPPRFVGFIQDTTLRQQALAAVQRERDRANRYLEAAQTMLVALDPDWHVTLINRKGCEILGWDEQTLLGREWIEFIVTPDHRARVATAFDTLVMGVTPGPLHIEYSVVRRDGAQRLVAWRCVAIEEAPGTATGILCSGDDVTDSRRAESEAREARERMTHFSRLATMGEMATGISHEISQPLAAIANYANAGARLLSTPTPDLPETREALAQIANQALRAGEIIRRLRSLVVGRTTERELTNVNDVIEELGPLTRADARASDVRLNIELAGGLPRVNVDRIQIQQVLLNLLRNSIDALERTEPELRQILIRTSANSEGEVTVTVSDTGAGVAAEFSERLFMAFATTKVDGTGLGLAISRRIVEAHRGRLEYQPNRPRGATFIVTLPGE